jgi:hypothetical protein
LTISQQNKQFKNIHSFFSKNVTKSLFLVTICNLTHLQDGNTKVKFMLRILEKIHVGFLTGSGYGSGSETIWKIGSVYESEKIIPDPQFCLIPMEKRITKVAKVGGLVADKLASKYRQKQRKLWIWWDWSEDFSLYILSLYPLVLCSILPGFLTLT